MPTPPNALFIVDDVRFEQHVAQGPHPERPERLRALREGLIAPLRDGGASVVAARTASQEELCRAHSEQHVRALEQALAAGEGLLDEDTFFSAGSHRAAWLAAGSAAELTAHVLARNEAAFVLSARPPGHHATKAQSMGFCLLNNVAVAAHEALARGAARVAIVDWDVHHGNGTADIFADDPRVLFVSLHQWPLYPGTGSSSEIGRGAGLGYTINLPLPSGAGGIAYRAAMERVVEPALTWFGADVTLVSCGFDAHEDDPLANMTLVDTDYGALTRRVWSVAQRTGNARLGLCVEGGYDLGALERAGDKVARALLGEDFDFDSGRVDPAAERAIDATRRALSAHVPL